MHRPLDSIGREDGQDVQEDAEGEEQVVQSGWHVAQVPFIDSVPEGQDEMQLPLDANEPVGQTVQVSALPMHSVHPGEQPKSQSGAARLSTHVHKYPSCLPSPPAETSPLRTS